MDFKKIYKKLYWGLIVTFGLLYLLVAFVSTLHAIDFFRMANIGSLAILLGVAYEIGQASVLFSILMTKNREKFLPWLLMILLTGLQVTANVFASFKHMANSDNADWSYWYTSILKIFGVAEGTPETYQVIISWISGALLPIVALGMTALVAQNIKLMAEEGDEPEKINAEDLASEISKVRPTDDELNQLEDILNKKEGVSGDVDKIKKLMTNENPIETGAISDNLKKTIAPGLPIEEDSGNSPREQISKIKDESIQIDMTERIKEVIKDTPKEDISKIIETAGKIKTLEEFEKSPIGPLPEGGLEPVVNSGPDTKEKLGITHTNGLVDTPEIKSGEEEFPTEKTLNRLRDQAQENEKKNKTYGAYYARGPGTRTRPRQ